MTLKSDGTRFAIVFPNVEAAWIVALIMQRDANCEIVDEPPPDLKFVPGNFITLGNSQEERNA